MSESPDAPDFLDRLIARHTAPQPAAVRVRPRLPGPFERVEAVRAQAPASDEDALLWPATMPSAVPPPDAPRPAAVQTRTHTERERTVVRTEREPVDPAPRPSGPARAEVPLLRPATPVVPGPRPPADAGRRAAGRGRAEPELSQTMASGPIPRVRTPSPRRVGGAATQRRRHGGSTRCRTAGRGPAAGPGCRTGGAGADRAARSDGRRDTGRRRAAAHPRQGAGRDDPEPRGLPGAGARVSRAQGSARRPAGREEPRN